ncbi:HEPN domain-containing protein [Methanoregula sp.]|uniref:ApeA N-terminal domain 1-containing protein n=1 Tax=Methanoregula sp. TaxID=2052170 RepID=UPI002371FB34|nr:HEPN domain-containing protein [Methanoregula sp.]MDD1685935.1 hypothetical protein [Methanoregula sp.]
MKEDIVIKGRWWIPTKARKKIIGTLTVSPSGRGILELVGTFHYPTAEHDFGSNFEVILGQSTLGTKVTLHNCQVQSTQVGATGFETQVYAVDTTFIGLHAKSVQKLKFKRVRVYFKHLDHLIKNSSVQTTTNKKTLKQTIRISNPKPVHLLTFNGFNIKIHPTNRLIGSYGASSKIEVNELTFISIESKKKEQEYQAFLDIIFKLQQLLTFCLSKPTYPTELSGDSSSNIIKNNATDSPIYDSIRIITHWNDLIDPSDTDSIHPFQIVFTFNNPPKKMNKIMMGWFEKSNENKAIFELYFATMFNSKMYLNNIYLTLAQCLESYHRKSPRYHDYLINPDAYQQRVDTVKKVIKEHSILGNSQRKSIISLLKSGNKPSLEKRIDQLLNNYSSVSPIIIGFELHFAKTIADNRNHLTHLDPRSDVRYATNVELYYLSLRMRLLMITIILDEIGFGQEDINDIIPRISQGFRLPSINENSD